MPYICEGSELEVTVNTARKVSAFMIFIANKTFHLRSKCGCLFHVNCLRHSFNEIKLGINLELCSL